MTNTEGMNICKSSECLVSIKFDQHHWHWLIHLIVMLKHSENCLGNVVHDKVEVDLIGFLALRVEGMLQINDIWMI